MQQVNLKRAGRKLRKLLLSNKFYLDHNVITEQSVFDGVETSHTERAQNLQNWAKTEALSLIKGLFGDSVDISKINMDNLILLEASDFKILVDTMNEKPLLEGFYDGKHTIIKIPDSSVNNQVYETIIHEILHQISSPEYNTFFDTDDKLVHKISGFENMTRKRNKSNFSRPHEGFNEAVTDYFASVIKPEVASSEYSSAYFNAVQNLSKLLNFNIDGLNIEVLKQGYLTNDLTKVRDAIDTVAGEGFFETELRPAFNESIYYKEGSEKLNEVVNKLGNLLNNYNGLRKNAPILNGNPDM